MTNILKALSSNGLHPQTCLSNLSLPIHIISATTISGGIGFQEGLPWPSLETDMKYFQYVTTTTSNKNLKNAVVMGRNTWFSIPQKIRPLKNRINFILSKTMKPSDEKVNVNIINSLENLFLTIENNFKDSIESIFIIGGEELYKSALATKAINTIYLTRIWREFESDRFFPKILTEDYYISSISKTFVEKKIPFDFVSYKLRKTLQTGDENIVQNTMEQSESLDYNFDQAFLLNISNKATEKENKVYCHQNITFKGHQEFQYLDCIAHILNNGFSKDDRTGIGSISTFGYNMRFCLRNSFPLLTTKRVFWKGVVEELLWFIKGDTNGNKLLDKGVKIWKPNGSREYLDSIGLYDREENDLGPIYGFQWRHFGAEYIDMHTDYKGQGVDQLLTCIEQIKKNKNDRRIILTAWNPSALSKMALPPCHMLCQFNVLQDELSCMMVQRSCDMGLGVPFNIASYSLLTCLIAQVCNLKAGDFYYCLGDAHIYKNHIESLKLQIQREPRPFPILELNEKIQNIEDFNIEDIKIKHYSPHQKIDMDMAV